MGARTLRDVRTLPCGRRYAGVFQALELQVRGYPIHMPIEEFVARYSAIVTENLQLSQPAPATADPATPKQTAAAGAAVDKFNSASADAGKADAIRDYATNTSAQLRGSKNADRIHVGTTKMLYCGTWCVAPTRVPVLQGALLRPSHISRSRSGESLTFPPHYCTGTVPWRLCASLRRSASISETQSRHLLHPRR